MSGISKVDIDQQNILSETFRAYPETVYLTRELARSALASWGLGAFEGDACQIMTELASNAARLCKGRNIRVWVSRIDQGVELCVWDDHPGRPVIQQPHPFDTSGRGLVLVQAFASGGCGWFEVGAGKAVWARIAIDRGHMINAAREAGLPIVGRLRHVERPRTPLRS
ncbi:ATP-binding protein [Actinomadura latina]|uniref:ATP-binding protein n=1 Tax=Actinomadura latina TaxID=163603 RepID=A0A846YWF8_9ACTN|nr:ATP-binding protein [Actinomadura latina]NKZ02944.1 ATP-binding protein [Actinomadura latina]